MNKKKILSLLATFMTGLSLAPSSRSMAYDHPDWAKNYYENTDKRWDCFTEFGEELDGNAKGIFKNSNVKVKELKIKHANYWTGNEWGWFQVGYYNNYYGNVAGFKIYIDDKHIQISKEGFLLDSNLNFVNPSGELVDLKDQNATVYKVNVNLDGFARREDRMLNNKLSYLEHIEDDAGQNIYKINVGDGFYLAYKQQDKIYILRNSNNNEIEFVELNNNSVTPENKNAFTFNADYLKFSYDEAANDDNIIKLVKQKFVVQQPHPRKIHIINNQVNNLQVQPPQMPPQGPPQGQHPQGQPPQGQPPNGQPGKTWDKESEIGTILALTGVLGYGTYKCVKNKNDAFEYDIDDDEDFEDDGDFSEWLKEIE